MKNQINYKARLKGTIAYFNVKNDSKKMKILKQKQIFVFSFLVLSLFSISQAIAGTGGSELSPLYNSIKGITSGTGGIIATLLAISFGAVQMIKQSVMPAVLAIGSGLLFQAAPTIAEAIVTACI